MIDLYYWPTPNGHKITIFLEEAALEYRLIPVNIGSGEQFTSNFLKISPNNKIPAIVDDSPTNSQPPIALFESGAILLYLADKIKRFIPNDLVGRYAVLQWLFWQVAGLGPMLGQNHHFNLYAPEKVPYAIDRYMKETARLYAVLDKQLKDTSYIAGDYSIADMACYPWIAPYQQQGQNLDEFPHLKDWFERMQQRPAVMRAYELGAQTNASNPLSDSEKKILFGQDKNTVKRD